MSRLRWGRTCPVAVGLVLAALLPAVAAGPPASASHTVFSLQVTPEVSTVQVGTGVSFTARIYTGLLVRLPGTAVLGGVKVNFSFLGGPLQGTADTSCTIADGQSTCSIGPIVSPGPGTSLVRAWIDGDAADTVEARLANNLAAENPAADCLPEDPPASTCVAGEATGPGAAAEPDVTDVVRATWLDHGLDLTPDSQTRALSETATVTATVTDLNGAPAPGVQVRWEFFQGSVSDPEGTNTPGFPDRTCTTGAGGTCAITTTQTTNGVDLVCAWTSPAPPAMSGLASEASATCASEPLVDATANDGKPQPVDDDQDVARITWGTGPPTTTTTGPGAATTPPPVGTGYWLVARDGGVFAFGDAVFRGSTGAIRLNQPMVGMAATPTRNGYWLVAADGGIFAFGDAVFRGSTGATRLNQPIVGMAPAPNGAGYWLVARDGGVFAFGSAVFRGSTGAIKLAQPMVGMASTPTGNGYWLVAADGGVFAFGDARFHGSTGGMRLAQPIVGMAATPSGNGYWLVAADGGIFAFGDAVFRGSTGGIRLNQPIVGMSRGLGGAGYRLVARDGGIFAFGDAPFRGSTGAIRLNQPMVGMSGF